MNSCIPSFCLLYVNNVECNSNFGSFNQLLLRMKSIRLSSVISPCLAPLNPHCLPLIRQLVFTFVALLENDIAPLSRLSFLSAHGPTKYIIILVTSTRPGCDGNCRPQTSLTNFIIFFSLAEYLTIIVYAVIYFQCRRSLFCGWWFTL